MNLGLLPCLPALFGLVASGSRYSITVNLAVLQRFQRLSLSVGVGAGAAASRSQSLLLGSVFAMEGRKVPRVPELSTEGPSSAGFKTYSAAVSADRISLVSGHLSHQTSSYNAASPALSSATQARSLSTTTANMSSQPEHATLLIPGPIEFDDDVLKSMGHYRYVATYTILDNALFANIHLTVRAMSVLALSTPLARPSL